MTIRFPLTALFFTLAVLVVAGLALAGHPRAAGAQDVLSIPEKSGGQQAQPPPENTGPDPMAMLAMLPPAMQKEILDEADQANRFCAGNHLLGNFYDCSCVALDIIRRRIEIGPGDPLIGILRDDDYKQCAHGPLIAGYAYTRCMELYAMTKFDEERREDACICSGRLMSETFMKHPKANIYYVDNLFGNVIERCSALVKSGAFRR